HSWAYAQPREGSLIHHVRDNDWVLHVAIQQESDPRLSLPFLLPGFKFSRFAQSKRSALKIFLVHVFGLRKGHFWQPEHLQFGCHRPECGANSFYRSKLHGCETLEKITVWNPHAQFEHR